MIITIPSISIVLLMCGSPTNRLGALFPQLGLPLRWNVYSNFDNWDYDDTTNARNAPTNATRRGTRTAIDRVVVSLLRRLLVRVVTLDHSRDQHDDDDDDGPDVPPIQSAQRTIVANKSPCCDSVIPNNVGFADICLPRWSHRQFDRGRPHSDDDALYGRGWLRRPHVGNAAAPRDNP